MWLLGAFVASWMACWSVGFIMRGWVEQERARTIPEHPSLRTVRDEAWQLREPRFRIIEGGLQRPPRIYDWEEQGG